MNAFRIRHLENCLLQFDKVTSITLPLDRFLLKYFQAHARIGRSDKIWISDQVYELHRWKGLVDHVTAAPVGWSSRLKTFFCSRRWQVNTKNENLPPHIRASFPQPLFEKISASLGEKQALYTCLVLNEVAPRFLRVNTLRISRDRLYRSLQNKGVPVEKCPTSPIGLQLTTHQRLLDLPEYSQGLLEIQDESSQLMAMRVGCKPGQTVLDFCSGTGGKAGVIGVALENKGKILLHDVRLDLLQKAKVRMRGSGVKNFLCVTSADLPRYKGKCDWVVCDVPCSGSGSLRRNPDLKWHYSDEWLWNLVETQQEIVKQAVQYMKQKGGKLVYMTQSILDEENAHQVRYFCNTWGLRLVEEPYHSLPLSRGLDGFFSVVLELATAEQIEDKAIKSKQKETRPQPVSDGGRKGGVSNTVKGHPHDNVDENREESDPSERKFGEVVEMPSEPIDLPNRVETRTDPDAMSASPPVVTPPKLEDIDIEFL